jgi:hypothetical protein
VLAYVFWHRPRDLAASDEYEQAHVAFHRSLAHSPPFGFYGSAAFRLGELPWPWSAASAQARLPDDGAGGYEDWYLVEDHTALGVLNEAAVGRGHGTLHDAVAHRSGEGCGGLYGLLEGVRPPALADATLAVWVSRPAGSEPRALGELLGDGMDPQHASLWRRQLVLGPAPEYCLQGRERPGPSGPQGVAATRLPDGWRAVSFERVVVFGG